MTNKKLSELTKRLNIVQFILVAKDKSNDAKAIYDEMLELGSDDHTLGFWVWDIPKNVEYYSPKFRDSLGFDNEADFPNTPESWMKQINEVDKGISLNNFTAHVATKGREPYDQIVTYRKKNGGKVSLICHGMVVSWENDKPKIMIGMHLPYENK